MTSAMGLALLVTSCHVSSVDLTGEWRLVAATGPHLSAGFVEGRGAFFERYEAVSGCQDLELSTRVDGDQVSIAVEQEGHRRGGCDGDFPGDPDDLLDGRYDDLLRAVTHGSRDGDLLTLSGHGVQLVFQKLGDVD